MNWVAGRLERTADDAVEQAAGSCRSRNSNAVDLDLSVDDSLCHDAL